MVLVRGLPGSGKTTYAKENFVKVGFKHFETDMFFTKDGVFRYEPGKTKQATEWCHRAVRDAVKNTADIVVSNHFIRHWEMGYYLELAVKNKYDVVVHTCLNNNQASSLYPAELLQYMQKTFEA